MALSELIDVHFDNRTINIDKPVLQKRHASLHFSNMYWKLSKQECLSAF